MWHKNIKAQNSLILLLSFVGIGSSLYLVNLNTPLNEEEKQLIRITVLSDIFQHVVNQQDESLDYFFVSISGSDPSPNLLDAFQHYNPAVKPISASVKSFGFSAPVVSKKDHTKKGMSFELYEPESMAGGNVNVLIKMYRHRGSSGSYEFTLSKRDGIYKVISVDYPQQN